MRACVCVCVCVRVYDGVGGWEGGCGRGDLFSECVCVLEEVCCARVCACVRVYV